jgi:lysophospholipase L1-like esterase
LTSRPFPLAALLIAAGFATACGDTPTQPSAQALTITCPASLVLPTGDGNPVAGTFALPQVSGGTAPLATTCDPQSGSAFRLGSNQVTCTVRDARAISAACSFGVTVVKVPVIAATKFVAFGDSITEGQINTPCGSAVTSFADYLRMLQLSPRIFDPTGTYPAKLQALLNGRYLAQTIIVVNKGLGNEQAVDGSTRLPGVLASESPDALVLLEGTNDMSAISVGAFPGATISSMVGGLRTMIRTARQRGLPVFVGTLLPQRPGACRDFASAYIADANAAIRLMVVSEGATLVDLYAAFGGVAGDLIGPDGLHPTDAGHQRIAETFFSAIRGRLER